MGPLILTANSILDYTTTAGILTFNSLADGGFTLSIMNYIRTGAPGGIDQLIFNESQTAADLSHFDFGYGAGNNVAVSAIGGGYYEVYSTIPVPEPSTWLSGILALVSLGLSRRRGVRVAFKQCRS